MPYTYAPEQRNNAEREALTAIRRVIRSKGQEQAVFYVAVNTVSPMGKQASLIARRLVKDKTGTKTLLAGKKMRDAMNKANQLFRGVIRFDPESMELVFDGFYKKGNAGVIKKRLRQDLRHRTGKHAEHDPRTAKRLHTLVKRARFIDSSGLPDEDARETVKAKDLGGKALSGRELRSLGIDLSEEVELSELEALLSTQLGALDEDIRASFEQPDQTGILRGQSKVQQELQMLRRGLRTFGRAQMREEDRTQLLEQVNEQLRAIRRQDEGPNPFELEVGDTVSATYEIMLGVAEAQKAYLDEVIGTRTAGMETEYVRTTLSRHRTVLATPCPTCNAPANELCKRDDDLVGDFHWKRQEPYVLDDHTPMFQLREKDQERILCRWLFETQGQGSQYFGTMEAITEPWTLMEGNIDAAKATLEAIDKVHGHIGIGVTVADLPKRVQKSLKYKDTVVFKLNPKLPTDLYWDRASRRSPQVTMTSSLSTVQDLFLAGLPEDSQAPLTLKANNAQLEDAVHDGNDLYRRVVGSQNVTESVGTRLRGFLTLVAQWAVATSLNAVGENEHAFLERSNTRATLKRNRRSTKHKDEEVTRLWYWEKDRYPLLPKAPLALLACDGGLSDEELELLRNNFDQLCRGVERIMHRYDSTLDRDWDGGGLAEGSVEKFLARTVSRRNCKRPGGPTAKPPVPFPPEPIRRRDPIHWDWTNPQNPEAFQRWKSQYQQEFLEWIRLSGTDVDPYPEHPVKDWIAYEVFRNRAVRSWGASIGDETAHVIDQFDGETRRVPTEIRTMSPEPTSEEILTSVATRMAALEQQIRTSALEQTLGMATEG